MSYRCLNSGQGSVSPHRHCRQDGAPPTCHSHHCLSAIPDFLSGSQSSAFSDPQRHRRCFCPPSALRAALTCVVVFLRSTILQSSHILANSTLVHTCRSSGCSPPVHVSLVCMTLCFSLSPVCSPLLSTTPTQHPLPLGHSSSLL